ncbi:MAG: tetraprenyl-beta-curcumene synthase family protein [Firmicutes bacterium]|nr:tetraprenyl-beta-curcumene synthase family protein [Bacillota bacterium]
MLETAKNNTSLPTGEIVFFLTAVIPKVFKELRRWNRKIEECPDSDLYFLAKNSLRLKRFHSQGGSYFTLSARNHSPELIRAIVALQTISDYLDNLCDRNNCHNEAAFRYLHLAMSDALSPGPARKESYYRYYPLKDDGGYLEELVSVCRQQVAHFSSYETVKNDILRLVSLYNDLQTYKHMCPSLRGSLLKRWCRTKNALLDCNPNLFWWEYAAACGSTLAIFALLALSTRIEISANTVKAITRAYFPWVCGLHILLDYLIDQEEDLLANDFNFIACYPSSVSIPHRLQLFFRESMKRVSILPRAHFHQTIVKGLLAVYLSDPKAQKPDLKKTAALLIESAGPDTRNMFNYCIWLRRLGIL